MSTLSQFAGGGVKSVQTGYVSAQQSGSGAGQDAKYYDITISSVTVAKCMVNFRGGYGSAAAAAIKPSDTDHRIVLARLTSSTNLRLSTPGGFTTGWFVGEWEVVEFA